MSTDVMLIALAGGLAACLYVIVKARREHDAFERWLDAWERRS